MKRTTLFTALLLGLGAFGAAGAESLRTESQVRTLLIDEGYVSIDSVQLNDGTWLANAFDESGKAVMLRIDPLTADIVTEMRGPTTTVTKTTRVTTRRAPQPEPRIVREVVEVPGPERIVEVPGPERVVEVPGPERVVTKVVEVPGPERVVREREVVQVPVTVKRSSPMSADEATSHLRAAGYHDIHDLSYRNGKWKAEAEDATGDDREIHIDAFSGAIVHVEDD